MFNKKVYTGNYELGVDQQNPIITDVNLNDVNTEDNVFQSRLAKLCHDFRVNGTNNERIRRDALDGMRFLERSISSKPKPPSKFISSQIKKLKTEEKKYRLTGGKSHGGKPPTFDFNINAKEYHNALINEENPEVINRILGPQVSTQTYLPQQLTVTRQRPLNLNRLFAMGFSEATLAVQKGILLNEKVQVSSGMVGIHYLAAVTIIYDLLRAMDNEWTLFQTVTPFYNYARSFLTPRIIDQYSYEWTNVPLMEDLLTTGIPFELEEPGPNHVSLAWLTGTYNGNGQAELVNTIPVLSVDDLENVGVGVVAELWKRILQQSEGQIHMIEPFIHDRAERSAAAFAVPKDLGVTDYNGYLTSMSEVSIRKHEHFMSSLMLVDPSTTEMQNTRGSYIYRGYAGSCAFNWRLLNQDLSTRKFNPKPRQVPLSSYLIQILGMIIQADLIAHDVVPSDVVIQPTGSYVKLLNAGDFLMAVASFILKRYAINNFLMMGTDSINTHTHKLGVGTEFIIDYGSVINGVLPAFVTEGMASLVLKPIKTANGEYDLMIPYIIMTGNKTNSDPTGNTDVSDPLSVVSLLRTMYPAIDATTAYQLGDMNPYVTFNIGVNHTSYLYGDAVNTAITNFNVLVEGLQGYFDIGMSLGNIHEEPFTLADYTYLCTSFDNTTPWDDAATTRITGLASVIAFDPDRVSDQLTRILPVVFGRPTAGGTQPDDFDAYIAMTGETTSLQLSIEWSKQITTSSVANVHPIAGIGNETSIADRSITARGGGGGVMDFLKVAGKAAIPAISAILGGVADSYMPGTGGIVRGLGGTVSGLLSDRHVETPFVRGLLKKGHQNPYARILRPITDFQPRHNSMYHVTPKRRYY